MGRRSTLHSSLRHHVQNRRQVKHFQQFSYSNETARVLKLSAARCRRNRNRESHEYTLESHDSNNSVIKRHQLKCQKVREKKMAANNWIVQKNILCLYNCNLLLMFSDCANATLTIAATWKSSFKIINREIYLRRRHIWVGRVCQIGK